MNTTNISILTPEDGAWLTENVENLEARTFSKSVVNPQDNAWAEWTDEQKEEWEAEHIPKE